MQPAYNEYMTINDQPIRRKQAERTQQRKEQVIREATRLFGEYGYRGARLADIASAAGVSEPGLLHHFHSKEELLMAVLAERDRADQDRYGAPLQEDQGQALSALQALVEHNETVPGLVQLFSVLVAESISPEHPGHAFFQQRYNRYRLLLEEQLSKGQGKGLIRADLPPKTLAVMILAMMDGLQVQWLLDPDAVSMSEAFEAFTRLLGAKRE